MITNAELGLTDSIVKELKSVTIGNNKAFPIFSIDEDPSYTDKQKKAIKEAAKSTYKGKDAPTLEHMITIITNKTIEAVVNELCLEYAASTAEFTGTVDGLGATGSIQGLVDP